MRMAWYHLFGEKRPGLYCLPGTASYETPIDASGILPVSHFLPLAASLARSFAEFPARTLTSILL